MLEHLGQTCRDARLAAGLRQIDIATTAETTDATISRFELGVKWPIAVDGLVAAYAAELDTEPVVLWESALTAWKASRA